MEPTASNQQSNGLFKVCCLPQWSASLWARTPSGTLPWGRMVVPMRLRVRADPSGSLCAVCDSGDYVEADELLLPL
jgi:hypothetical protein